MRALHARALLDFRSLSRACQAAKCNTTPHDIMVLSLVDFNTPWARSTDRMLNALQLVQQLNDLAPNVTASILTMPDKARASSHRGLADEENAIQKELWALHQQCNCR